MKNLLSILLISFASVSMAQNYDVNAYQFHQSILEAQKNIGNEMFEFNERATELNLKILKFEIKRSIQFIDSLKIYNNETTYYNAAKNLFATYNDIANNDHKKLLEIIENPDLEFKDFKAQKLAIFETIKKKMAKVYPAYNEAQLQFCTKYKLKIE